MICAYVLGLFIRCHVTPVKMWWKISSKFFCRFCIHYVLCFFFPHRIGHNLLTTQCIRRNRVVFCLPLLLHPIFFIRNGPFKHLRLHTHIHPHNHHRSRYLVHTCSATFSLYTICSVWCCCWWLLLFFVLYCWKKMSTIVYMRHYITSNPAQQTTMYVYFVFDKASITPQLSSSMR